MGPNSKIRSPFRFLLRHRLSACLPAPISMRKVYQITTCMGFCVFVFTAILWLTYPTAASPMSNVIVGAFGGDIIALGSLDMKSGALQLSRFSKAAGPAPSFFAWLSNHQQQTSVLNVLAANEAGPASAVTAVQLLGLQTPSSAAGTDKKTAGALTAIQMMSLPADSPCHVAIHSSGKWAFSASYPAGTVTVMEVITVSGLFPGSAAPAGGGAATAQVPKLLLRKAATLPTQLVGQAAHQVALAGPGDLFVYVPCLKSNWVRMFKFDQATGQLTANNYKPGSPSKQQLQSSSGRSGPGKQQQSKAASGGSSSSSSRNLSVQPGDNKVFLPAGAGPRHIIFHPRLPVAYVLNELASTIARFDWDTAAGGHLLADFNQQPERIVSMLPAGTTSCSIKPQQPATSGACKGQACLQAGAELVLSSDAKFLYASNRGKCGGINSIVIYAVAPSTGALQALAWEDAGGDINFPRHISLTPDQDNSFLLVANQERGTLTVLRRDVKTGLLTKVETVPAASADGATRVVEPAFISVVP